MEFSTVEEIFTALDKSRGKLTDTVSTLTDEDASFKTAPEKWSTANIVEHLAKTEEGLSATIAKFLAKAEAANIPSTGKIEPPVSFAEITGTYKEMKFEAPEFIRPSGTVALADSLARLENSRAALKALRPRLEAVDLSGARFPHPAFGPMNLYYWLAFIGLHELHHLKQINDILANRG